MENIVRKGEIVCYKQFFLFSECLPPPPPPHTHTVRQNRHCVVMGYRDLKSQHRLIRC